MSERPEHDGREAGGNLSGEKLSLSGRVIVTTRAHEQNESLARLLRRMGAEVLSIPTISIQPPQSFQPLDRALKKIPSYDWLVVTSVNGVKALEKRMEAVDIGATLLRGVSVCAIGPATQRAAEAFGLRVALVPKEYVAESVVEALAPQVAGKRILLVRAKVARDVIPGRLREAGAEVDIAEAYETVMCASSRGKLRATIVEAKRKPDAITFTSSSTVKNFIALLGQNVSPQKSLAGVCVASIGPVTSATLREAGLKPSVEAKEFTTEGVAAALAGYFAKGKAEAK